MLYCVIFATHADGSTLLGIFTTEPKAIICQMAFREKLEKGNFPEPYWVSVDPWEVDKDLSEEILLEQGLCP